jgi:3'-phosphoadenosine 5'-phosphosulfate sulfotransferase (PAPS reductase)/FAD synthetase
MINDTFAGSRGDIQKVTMFSGGRTSGLMLRILMDGDQDYNKNYITCFANTGKEMPETLDFVNEVQKRWRADIKWLEYRSVPARDIPLVYPTKARIENIKKKRDAGENWHWYTEVDYRSASRDGTPFDHVINQFGNSGGLPSAVNRYCTTQLKVRTVMRYLCDKGIYEYAPHVGFRKDEEHRKVSLMAYAEKGEQPQFPLIDAGIVEEDVNEYWSRSEFDLMLSQFEGNCDLCFLKSEKKVARIARERPESVVWWKQWEGRMKETGKHKNGSRFRLNLSISDIEYMANQEDLFLSENESSCSCAESGFNRVDGLL